MNTSKRVGYAVAVALTVMAMAGAVRAQTNEVTAGFCEANQAAANQAAAAALQNTLDTNRVVIGGSAGIACLLLSAGTGFLDGGVATAVCMALGAMTGSQVDENAAARAARDAYNKVRDVRCFSVRFKHQ
jgi:hypothetical protein